MELAEIAALKQQVLNVAETERTPNSFVVILDQVIQDPFFDLKFHSLQLRSKDRVKTMLGAPAHWVTR